MTINEFIAKWRKVELKERSAAQTHFIDLCRVFDHPDPVSADPTGETFCFEKAVSPQSGTSGGDMNKCDVCGNTTFHNRQNVFAFA